MDVAYRGAHGGYDRRRGKRHRAVHFGLDMTGPGLMVENTTWPPTPGVSSIDASPGTGHTMGRERSAPLASRASAASSTPCPVHHGG